MTLIWTHAVIALLFFNIYHQSISTIIQQGENDNDLNLTNGKSLDVLIVNRRASRSGWLFLEAQNRQEQVTLTTNGTDTVGGTRWRILSHGQFVTIQSFTERTFLHGHPNNASVALSIRRDKPETHWHISGGRSSGYYVKTRIGNEEKRYMFLDGLTEAKRVLLAPSTKGPNSGAVWSILPLSRI